MKGDPALRAMMMSTRRPRLWRPTRVEAVQASRPAIYNYVVDPTQFISLRISHPAPGALCNPLKSNMKSSGFFLATDLL